MQKIRKNNNHLASAVESAIKTLRKGSEIKNTHLRPSVIPLSHLKETLLRPAKEKNDLDAQASLLRGYPIPPVESNGVSTPSAFVQNVICGMISESVDPSLK